MTYISLYYHNVHGLNKFDIKQGSIDELSASLDDFQQRVATLDHRVKQFRLARDTVKTTNEGVECDVHVVRFPEADILTLISRINHKTPEIVESAARQYIDLAGVPVIIGRGSDYELARRVLQEYGKDIKISWWNKGDGAYVIDKTKQHKSKKLLARLQSARNIF